MSAPLSVLDLVPISAGSDKVEALRNAADLAQQAEAFGYSRYWFAEHHLNPGVIGVSPAVAIALVGHATSSIRLGSAGVQFGHRTPLATVEEFGLLDAVFPGRIDLGIGRSLGRSAPSAEGDGSTTSGVSAYLASRGGSGHDADQHADNGLLLPKAWTPSSSPARFATTVDLLQQPGAYTPAYGEQVDQVLELLRGTYVSAHDLAAHAYPGEGSDLQVWILGSSGGSSGQVAGERGLPFVASYHHSPATVLDAVDSYREAFAKAGHDHDPYVAVSADVVVADTDEDAQRIATGYASWVLSIRSGQGAIAFPTPQDAAAREWTEDERELVTDRVRTQLVGSPSTVAARLRQLQEATDAQELSITTITHDHADRVRSYELLAKEWFGA